MKLTPMVLFKQISEFWKKQNKKMKTILIASVVGFAAVAVIAAALLNHKGYVVLYRGLSSSEAGEIITRLDEMAVDSKIQNDGSILVPTNDEARLKMLLSAEGYPQSALNYDVFSNNSDFMTTDYEKKKYLIFQLQNRLQDAIKTLSGVNSAIVTISVPDDSSFVLEADKVPPTASVLLDLRGSNELDKQQIKGIEQLVAKSVPGLETKNVAIVDGTGTILNNTESDSNAVAAGTRMELENSMSQTVKDRVINLLQPVFGRNRLSVAVNTSIEVNKKISEQTTYTPVIDQSGIVAKQDQTKEGTNGIAAASGAPGMDSNSGVVTYPAQAVDNTANGSTNESSSTDYLVNQLKEQVERDGYEIKDLSVAVIIGDISLSQDELASYREMVAFAAGIDTNKVVISGVEFSDQKNAETSNPPVSSLLKNLQGNPLYLFVGLGVILLFLIALIIFLRSRGKNRKPSRKGRKSKHLETENERPDIQTMLEGKAANLPGEIVLSETREQGLKKQIKEFSSNNPDIVAQLIRTWIKEDDENNG